MIWLRRVALAVILLTPGFAARAQVPDIVKIGILNDMNGPFADQSGRGSVVAAQMAAEDFAGEWDRTGGTTKGGVGFKVEVLGADHQNKPDIGAQIARQWVDRDGVTAIAD